MLKMMLKIFIGIWNFAKLAVYPVVGIMILFTLLCLFWHLKFKYKDKLQLPPSGQVPQRRKSILYQLLIQVPRRYVYDMYQREEDYFYPGGIHMFCGEQGCGKTSSAVEMITRLQAQYPKARVITNFGLTTENKELKKWQQLLNYTNGHQGVIVGIDEIQNWFMSGTNKLPEQMLEVATQNRKNNRIIVCTAQVFTRVNKGLREQVSLVYNPHTYLGCFTIVIKRKPEFDDEGNVTKMKYRGMYAYVHTDKLRESYDTYKVIHTLAREGFKEQVPVVHETKVYVQREAK